MTAKSIKNYLHDVQEMPANSIAILAVYPTGARNVVIERDDDALTAQEVREHAAEVQAARKGERRTGARQLVAAAGRDQV